MKSKKAVSAVIATVLLILITIAAVAIIWGSVRSMVKQGANEANSPCTLADLSITKACKDGTNVLVTVERGASDWAMSGVQITQLTADGSEASEQTGEIDANGMKVYTVVAETGATAVKIAPMIGTEICGITDAATIAASC
jgi:flagellin-like protein